ELSLHKGERIQILEGYYSNRAASPSLNFLIPPKSINPTCAAWRCRLVASAAHVRAPGGVQQRLCRRHWLAEREAEGVEVARYQLAALFRASCPRGPQPGGCARRIPIAVGLSFAATSARIGVDRRAV